MSFVQPYKNQKFSEFGFQNAVFTAYQVRGFCECTHWPFAEVFNERTAALCISLKINISKKLFRFALILCDREVEGMFLDN